MDNKSKILELISYARRRNSGVLIVEDDRLIDIIEDSLEKQIAKTVTRKDMLESFKCPNCNEDKSWKDGICCKDCGQLLDWSTL